MWKTKFRHKKFCFRKFWLSKFEHRNFGHQKLGHQKFVDQKSANLTFGHRKLEFRKFGSPNLPEFNSICPNYALFFILNVENEWNSLKFKILPFQFCQTVRRSPFAVPERPFGTERNPGNPGSNDIYEKYLEQNLYILLNYK